ncbi:uncharacterized protein A1O5_10416 [Cladophialophora psammophila CBS 110553]|uniref:Extracellular membrane protein CFEM domain-containing protein n=1 Tax=Cladophialophora psammophila CBS 110553 TaxID=1182543 RepID=W9X745_9EURO|nr:uncharacterized protein A1O5_10416 [Cladophialophora psammophila CBS 110553]EXJ66264.1 hypothetical protein A1O5_10416 [Cladophialophora psammophila CBS 110553]
MPTIKSTILTVLVASATVAVTVALPSPQQAAATDASDAAPLLHLEVQCGCWNLCTLQALGDASIAGCDSACDPQFLCETIDALTGGPTTIVAATPWASASAISKRGGSLGGTPPPFNPFGPGGAIEEESQPVTANAKRAFDIRPTPGPTVPDEPPFPGVALKAKRAPERLPNPWQDCRPGQTDCPSPVGAVVGVGKRNALPSLPLSPIIDPGPKGVVCEAVAKRDPDPRPPVEPRPDCPPPEDGGLAKRMISWDLTIKGSCSGGGCSGEVSVTIHF